MHWKSLRALKCLCRPANHDRQRRVFRADLSAGHRGIQRSALLLLCRSAIRRANEGKTVLMVNDQTAWKEVLPKPLPYLV